MVIYFQKVIIYFYLYVEILKKGKLCLKSWLKENYNNNFGEVIIRYNIMNLLYLEILFFYRYFLN